MKVSFDIPDDVYHAMLLQLQAHPAECMTVDEAIEFELCSLIVEEGRERHPLLPWATKRLRELEPKDET